MLTISYPNNGYASARSARLRFSQWGLSCSVRGEEPVWVSAMLSELTREGRRRQPWWALIHTTPGYVAFILAVYVTLLIVCTAVFARLQVASTYWFLVPIASAVIASPLSLFLTRLFPRFELLEPGATATGSRRAAGLAVFILSGLFGSFLQFLFG